MKFVRRIPFASSSYRYYILLIPLFGQAHRLRPQYSEADTALAAGREQAVYLHTGSTVEVVVVDRYNKTAVRHAVIGAKHQHKAKAVRRGGKQ